MVYGLDDCCLHVTLPDGVEPALVLWSDDVDPFTGDEIGWPEPRVYWSNGTITEGWVEGIKKGSTAGDVR